MGGEAPQEQRQNAVIGGGKGIDRIGSVKWGMEREGKLDEVIRGGITTIKEKDTWKRPTD